MEPIFNLKEGGEGEGGGEGGGLEYECLGARVCRHGFEPSYPRKF